MTAYLPTYEQTRVWRGHRRTFELPLFPGYLFFAGDWSTRIICIATDRVASIIPVVDQDQLISDLEAVDKAIRTMSPRPYAGIVEGVEVEVVRGPLRGQRGIVRSCDGVRKLCLQINMLGAFCEADINPADVEPVA